MRDITPAYQTALRQRSTVERRLIWLTVKNRQNNQPAYFGFGAVPGTIDIIVRDGLTGTLFNRSFRPGLVSVGEITLTSDLSVQRLSIELNGVDARVQDAIRGYDPRQAPIQVYSWLLDARTRVPVGPAMPIFVGFVDRTPIQTPTVGGDTGMKLECNSFGFELSLNNPETRSNPCQKQRYSQDRFYRYVQDIPNWKIRWGTRKGSPNQKDKSGGKKS